jgi:hypothetical protein
MTYLLPIKLIGAMTKKVQNPIRQGIRMDKTVLLYSLLATECIALASMASHIT